MMLNWELLEEGSYSRLQRLKIYGGWLIRQQNFGSGNASVDLLYIPDHHHYWELEPNESDAEELE